MTLLIGLGVVIVLAGIVDLCTRKDWPSQFFPSEDEQRRRLNALAAAGDATSESLRGEVIPFRRRA